MNEPSAPDLDSTDSQIVQPPVTPPVPVGQTSFTQEQFLQQQSAPQQVLLPQSPNYQQYQSPTYVQQIPYQPQPVIQPAVYPAQTVYFQPQPIIVGPPQPTVMVTERQPLIEVCQKCKQITFF